MNKLISAHDPNQRREYISVDLLKTNQINIKIHVFKTPLATWPKRAIKLPPRQERYARLVKNKYAKLANNIKEA